MNRTHMQSGENMLKSMVIPVLCGLLLAGCSNGDSETSIDPAGAGKQAMDKAKALEKRLQDQAAERLQGVDQQ